MPFAMESRELVGGYFQYGEKSRGVSTEAALGKAGSLLVFLFRKIREEHGRLQEI